jgi:hypothetical protein
MRYFMRSSPKRWALLLSFLIMLFAVGCGRKTGTVTGTVTIDGEPLKGGNVTFARNDGQTTMSGTINEDGSYKVENVPVGTVKVCVETKSMNPALASGGVNRPGARPGGGMGGPPPGVAHENKPPEGAKVSEHYVPRTQGDNSTVARYVAIPDHYADPTTTDLTYEVKRGPQDHPITLHKK